MSSGGRAAVLAALATLMVLAPSAGATVVTLGPSDIPTTPQSRFFGCLITCETPLTLAALTSTPSYVAPASGVITGWRINGEGEGPITLRVLEPATGGTFKATGTSAPATNRMGAPLSAELPIEAGDVIGVDLGVDAAVAYEVMTAGSSEVLFWRPVLAEGEIRRGEALGTKDLLLVNAEEELTPVITSVSPAAGTTAGGQTVTITGKYLDFALNVVFGSHPATSFSVDLSGDRITATTPASAAGTVDVHVSNLHSTSESVAGDKYTFVAPPATTTATPGGGAGPGAGGSAAVVSGFTESTSRWRRGTALPHISSTPVGTTFGFSLNEPASVALTFVHVLPGRRVGSKCVAPNHGNRSKAKCKRNLTAGTLAVSGHAGLNKVGFQGRLSSGAKLPPGSYSVTVTSRAGNGTRTLTRPLTFTIVA